VGTASAVAKRASVLADRVRHRPDGLVILIYHRVGGRSPVSVDLPTPLFAEQMAYLAEHCDVLTLDDAADRLSSPARPDDVPSDPKQPVVITFDDGTADFVDEALPVLAEHRLPATYYLATDFIERGASFPDAGAPMTWVAVREAVASGLVEIGSHTHDHILLDRTDPDLVAADLDRSIGRIADEVGVRPVHFAYPKALAPSRGARSVVRDRFASAALAGGRPNRSGATDLWALDRTPITVADGLDDVEAKVSGGLGLEAAVRSVVDRVRYRGAAR
jgi:peptidoglycan/xylan/chitin deacetylase (PgdA/CDA1 family)